MHSVNIHEAKTHLSELIARVERGEEVVIARAGKPVARLTHYAAGAHKKRMPGSMKGKIRVAPDFDEPDSELEGLFYDAPIFPDEK